MRKCVKSLMFWEAVIFLVLLSINIEMGAMIFVFFMDSFWSIFSENGFTFNDIVGLCMNNYSHNRL